MLFLFDLCIFHLLFPYKYSTSLAAPRLRVTISFILALGPSRSVRVSSCLGLPRLILHIQLHTYTPHRHFVLHTCILYITYSTQHHPPSRLISPPYPFWLRTICPAKYAYAYAYASSFGLWSFGTSTVRRVHWRRPAFWFIGIGVVQYSCLGFYWRRLGVDGRGIEHFTSFLLLCLFLVRWDSRESESRRDVDVLFCDVYYVHETTVQHHPPLLPLSPCASPTASKLASINKNAKLKQREKQGLKWSNRHSRWMLEQRNERDIRSDVPHHATPRATNCSVLTPISDPKYQWCRLPYSKPQDAKRSEAYRLFPRRLVTDGEKEVKRRQTELMTTFRVRSRARLRGGVRR